ncbi:MAG TPA: BON domain-containing protein [Thermoanaerobaculia bacterium]|nr:BON domain-containing protein [Thermoanaerobaculia bacterium]
MGGRNRATWIGLAVLLVAGAAGAARKGEAPRAPSEREAAIGALLVEKLGADARTIRVVVQEDKVVLSGEVVERVTQELAAEVAASFEGVRSTTNRVNAKNAPHLPEGQLLREGQDAELERRVQKALKVSDAESSKALEVEAADGVVCVRGQVADAERHLRALETARAVPGVTWVLDLVRVSN